MLSKNVDDLRKSQTTEGPGSSRLQGNRVPAYRDMAYGASRVHRFRWEYNEMSDCGFAELAPSFTLSGVEFFKLLEKVKGVSRVWWASSKSPQGNPGPIICS